jgi:hypothetical protein
MTPGQETATTTPRAGLVLDQLAAQVGREIETLAQLSADVQLALSLCRFSEHTDPRAIRGLQRIDRITQALEDLGRMMRALSEQLPRDLTLSAAPILAPLRLHELLARLDPVPGTIAPDPLADAGEFQWL